MISSIDWCIHIRYIYIYICTNRIYTDTYIPACPSFNSFYGSNLLKLPVFRRQMAPRVPALPKVRMGFHSWHSGCDWGNCEEKGITHRPFYTMKRDKGMYILQEKPYWLEELAAGSPKTSSFDQIHGKIETTLKVNGLEAEYTSCQRKFETSVGHHHFQFPCKTLGA